MDWEKVPYAALSALQNQSFMITAMRREGERNVSRYWLQRKKREREKRDEARAIAGINNVRIFP